MASRKMKDVFPKLSGFEEQVLVHRLATFTDYMSLTFDEEKARFVPLNTLSQPKRDEFSSNVFNRVCDILRVFDKLTLAPKSVLLDKGKEEDVKKHDMLLDVLKFNLPIIWHHKVKYLKMDEVMKFIPEEVENCAEIILDNNCRINIWKYEKLQETPDGRRRSSAAQKKDFELQWCPSYVLTNANSSPFKCITNKTCNSAWLNVLKRNKHEKNIWERRSIVSINDYLEEVSQLKF